MEGTNKTGLDHDGRQQAKKLPYTQKNNLQGEQPHGQPSKSWKRQIRRVRALFNRLSEKFSQRMTTYALRTAFCEVMTASNNRPLPAISITGKKIR